MTRTSIAREDIKHFKTLGLLGDIFKLSMEMRKQGIKPLPLHLGDPPQFDFKVPQSFTDGIIKALTEPISYAYGNPQGYMPLIEKIAQMENVDSKYVFTGNGLSDLMDKFFNATAVPGTNILFPAPVFPPYMDINIKNNVESRLYKCDVNTWQPIPKSIESKIDDNTSIILLNSPNNPTGAVYSEEIMKQILDIIEGVNLERKKKNIAPITVIFDEIYKELYFDQKPPESQALVKDRELTWVIFNGASKAFNATGLRVGYAIFGGIQRDELREVMYNECILPLCMNSPYQAGYLAALNDPGCAKYFEDNRKKLKKRRDLMLGAFEKIEGVSFVKPEGAFYVIVKIDSEFKNDRDLGIALLKEEQICASQMSAFFDKETQPEGTMLRLVILPPEEIIEDAMGRFKKFMERHRK